MTASPCPLCQSTAARPLFEPIEQCAGCGLARTKPAGRFHDSQPDPGQYDQDYFTSRNAYLSQQAAFSQMFARTLDQLQPFKATGALLDIGCGPGLLLKLARERGYATQGCDISEWATEYARSQGFDVRTGDVQTLGYGAGQFDVVVINHTLEHLPQPLDTLREACRVLKDDGVLLVGVPNFASFMSRVMRERWAGLLPDQHLWHFTPLTLTRALRQAGFRVLRLTAEPHIHRHPNRVKNLALGVLSRIGNALGRGDSLIAIAAKA